MSPKNNLELSISGMETHVLPLPVGNLDRVPGREVFAHRLLYTARLYAQLMAMGKGPNPFHSIRLGALMVEAARVLSPEAPEEAMPALNERLRALPSGTCLELEEQIPLLARQASQAMEDYLRTLRLDLERSDFRKAEVVRGLTAQLHLIYTLLGKDADATEITTLGGAYFWESYGSIKRA